jgi:hypothetical protein
MNHFLLNTRSKVFGLTREIEVHKFEYCKFFECARTGGLSLGEVGEEESAPPKHFTGFGVV